MNLKFLDGLSELAYVADRDTYEVLYVNEALRKRFNITLPCKEKCYKAFQGLDAPCPFCNNKDLELGHYITWEHANKVVASDFIIKDTLIEVDGKQVRLEICFEKPKNEQSYGLLPIINATGELLNCSYERFRQVIFRIVAALCERYGAQTCFLSDDIVDNQFAATHIYRYDKGCSSLFPMALTGSLMQDVEGFADRDHLYIQDKHELDALMPCLSREIEAGHFTSMYLLPLKSNRSEIGFLGFLNPQKPQLFDEDLRNLSSICVFIASAAIRLTRDQSLHPRDEEDPALVFSRQKLNVDLKLFEHLPMGCIVADINGLKEINDRQGHDKGDHIIALCLQVLREMLPNDRIYRIGDDEYTVLTLNCSKQDFRNKLFSVKKALSGPHGFSAAVGGQYDETGSDPTGLMVQAESRMHHDKAVYYRNSASIESRVHDKTYLQYLTRPTTIRDLINAGAFYTVMQPIYSVAKSSYSSAEALSRLRLDETEVSPGIFIPLLESVNLSYLIDLFNFERCCQQLQLWKDKGLNLLPLSVNFSRQTMLMSGLCQRISEMAGRYAIPPQLLCIEITESAAAYDRQLLIRQAAELAEAGFPLAVDDFGVDYANLITIADLPMSIVKFDRRMITPLQHNAKMRFIIQKFNDMCRELKVETIAEGVEDKGQAALAAKLGFSSVQGFYYSRPLTLDKFEELLTPAALAG
ncbi:MAG: EAL domain-containing protein [Proteobacteria bacterium]|uniref:EAL domain-containing protein n=1 Tax=Candidatus Avisuccinivibrio stercorigallinarum TaxID=2840704 RepID=A0A9D9DA44_9GAMM|nr:EAL domain-containing protein [Candidatus Avisuccinivibrio stercorigallinarum]